jgi:hypothetical protein
VGGLVKVGDLWWGGSCSLSQALLRLFAFKQVSYDVV